MSSLVGRAGDRWTLRQGSQALWECLRLAMRPSLCWIAGMVYPSIDLSLVIVGQLMEMLRQHAGLGLLGIDLGRHIGDPRSVGYIFTLVSLPWADASGQAQPAGVLAINLVWLLPLGVRLAMGLARAAAPRDWEEARGQHRSVPLSRIWTGARGLTLSGAGLWLCLQALLAAALLLVMGPLVLLVSELHLKVLGELLLVLLAPALALVILYASTLAVLNQLALPSLISNRRGPASALAHAWRLVRNDPWSALRAMMVDLGLWLVLAALADLLGAPASIGADAIMLVLTGIAGVARAMYWSRVYTALGGLRADEGVPGLARAREIAST